MSYLAEQLKDKGNAAFREGNFLEAEELYTQAIQKHSRNPLIFTNRANVRLKLQRWDEAINDCTKSIDINGSSGQNHKAFYFLGNGHPFLFATAPPFQLAISKCLSYEDCHADLPFSAQAQLALHHPHEALSSALTAYDQVLHPSPAAKLSPRDLETFSAFVLKCKKAKFAVRDRERLRRQGDLRAELEDSLAAGQQRDLDRISKLLRDGQIGQVEASEQIQEIRIAFDDKIKDLRVLFAVADPTSSAPREIPDHLVDMITFEPMHDPVITKNGHSYERATIYEHLKRSPTDPLTRDPLLITDLRSNYGLKAACDEFWASGASEWICDW